MKAKIAEKNTPSSVAFLKAAGLVIGALLIALTAIQLDEKSAISNELKYGFRACRTSVERSIFMSDINHYSRVVFGAEAGYVVGLDMTSVKNRVNLYIFLSYSPF